MTDIGTVITGPAQTHLGTQVGTVHVHTSPVAVDDVANLTNAGLEHTVSRRIGHHEGRKLGGVRLGLCG